VPISVDNIVQFNSGAVNDTTMTVTLPAPTTAGSALVMVTYGGSASDSVEHGTGFPSPGSWSTLSSGRTGSGKRGYLRTFFRKNVAAGLDTWTVSIPGGPALVAWQIYEVTGVGLDALQDSDSQSWFLNAGDGTGPSDNAGTTSTTVASKTSANVPADASAVTECFDALGMTTFGATCASAQVPVISGFSDGVTEMAQVGINTTDHGIALSVGFRQLTDVGRFSETASVSPNSYMASDFPIMYADGGRWLHNYDAMCGFEIGTATGITNGSTGTASSTLQTGTAPWDTVAGSPEVVSTFKSTGNYSLKLSSVAAAENVAWTLDGGVLGRYLPGWNNITDAATGLVFPVVLGFKGYFDGSLPSADTEIATIEAGSLANGMTLWYRSASQKLGVVVGNGTEVLSDSAISADKWFRIGLRYQTRRSSNPTDGIHNCDWEVDYDSSDATGPVAQTQATDSGLTNDYVTAVRLGWPSARTATMYVDDVVLSKVRGTYPLGDVRIVGLKVDPAGTPTLTGTATNFNTFTNNGTLAAWNATNARNAVDDIPPTVGASSDGLTQIAVATGDYVTFPMETFTAAPDNVLRAVCWYVAGWAKSGNPASLRVWSNDGTSDLFAQPLCAHGFDDTTLRWLCGMQRKRAADYDVGATTYPYLLTQTKLDGLSLNVGGSDDANPDVGIHAILAEVAYQPAITVGHTEGEGGAFKAYVRLDPVNHAVASLLYTTPEGTRGVTAFGNAFGSDWSQTVGPNTTYERAIGASLVSECTSIGMTVDAPE
jgi:hypothetical protein